MLYEKVLLTNTAQAKAVAQVVVANPTVGRAIKYLRLEGGMGKDLATIVKCAPNIHTLWITLHLLAAESITGLRKTITLLQPRKFYFHMAERRNKTTEKVKELIISSIAQSWASLVRTP